MNKLEEFKTFVKNNPRLIDKVQSSEYSWQQLYETYDIYGESHPLFSNKPKNENPRQPKCTKEKEDLIVDALKHFEMI